MFRIARHSGGTRRLSLKTSASTHLSWEMNGLRAAPIYPANRPSDSDLSHPAVYVDFHARDV
jgi:hypothetical protein